MNTEKGFVQSDPSSFGQKTISFCFLGHRIENFLNTTFRPHLVRDEGLFSRLPIFVTRKIISHLNARKIMVQMWYMDNSDCEDQRLPHHLFPPKMISIDRLMKKSGLFYRKMNMDDVGATKQRIDIIRKERGYKMEDECTLQENVTQNYDLKIKEFYKDHMREQDEARLILEGQAYFDVQDASDPNSTQWFRVLAEKGDFIVVPPGCLYRFTTDTNNFVKMRRFFCSEQPDLNVITGEDVINNPIRLKFLNEMAKKNTQNGNKSAITEKNLIKNDLVTA